MTKAEAYRFLITQDRDTAWVAGVFLTSGGSNAAKSLKAMAALIRSGHTVGSLPFTMPNERVYIDGSAKTPEEMREMANRLYSSK